MLTAEIRIAGAINDEEFTATGNAKGDPHSGEWHLRLDYASFPANWHPYLYIDAKIGLLFIRELDQGQNMHTLADGNFRASSTIDLGSGFVLRNNAVIERTGENAFRANYLMHGTARIFELTEVNAFQEIMVPLGPGRVAGLAVARWKGALQSLEAVMSTRYLFDNDRTLPQVQLRRFDAQPKLNGNTFEADYHAEVAPFSAYNNVFEPAAHAIT